MTFLPSATTFQLRLLGEAAMIQLLLGQQRSQVTLSLFLCHICVDTTSPATSATTPARPAPRIANTLSFHATNTSSGERCQS